MTKNIKLIYNRLLTTTKLIENIMPQTSKKQIIDKFKTHDGDTGSPEVQVALITQRIDGVKDHLKEHDHDNHSRRGLLSLINKRRRLLHYLMRKAPERYKDIIGKLNLSK